MLFEEKKQKQIQKEMGRRNKELGEDK